MKKVLFSLVVVMLILTSCGADAVKFNDSIIKEQTSMFSAIEDYSNKLSQAATNNSFAEIKAVSDSLLTKLDKSIEVIKGLNTPSGGEKFKEAAIDYFESAKKIITLGEKASSLGNEPTEEQATAFYEEYNNVVKDVTEKEAALLAVQKEFAKEKNMKLQ
ncbi:LIC11966 family surface protein [Dysgonomonas reticulitermitis]